MSRKRYFQWIDGEDKGKVVTLVGIEKLEDETFFHFDEGDSCNLRFISKMTGSLSDLRGKFMVEIEGPSNAWSIAEKQAKMYTDKDGNSFEVPTLHDMLQAKGDGSVVNNSDSGGTMLVPPRMTQHIIDLPSIEQYPMYEAMAEPHPQPERKTFAELEQKPASVPEPQIPQAPAPVQQPQVPILDENIIQRIVEMTVECIEANKELEQQYNAPEIPVQQETVDPNDPVAILVNKCKRHETPVTLELTLSLPSRSTYEFAKSEFEDGGEKFIKCIVAELDRTPIIDFLGAAFKNVYEQNQDVQE